MTNENILNYDALIEAILPRIKAEVTKEINKCIIDDNTRLTRRELCDRWNISLPTLWKYVSDGRLQPIYIGRRILFTLSEIKRAEKVGISCKVRVVREKGDRI
jgi:predicted DNA-binding transcriptional regulator AlpA